MAEKAPIPSGQLYYCCGPCRNERRRQGQLGSKPPTPMTPGRAKTGDQGGMRSRSACLTWALPPSTGVTKWCLWNCQQAKPQVHNKDHLCTAVPEVTSPGLLTLPQVEWSPTPGLPMQTSLSSSFCSSSNKTPFPDEAGSVGPREEVK